VKVSFGEFNANCVGLVDRLTRKDRGEMSERNRDVFEQFVTQQTCPLCKGARLNQTALASRINGRIIAEMSYLEATELVQLLRGFTDPVALRLADKLIGRIEHHLDVIRQTNWIVDLGPEGGSAGGEVSFEGTPADIVHEPRSITGPFLARHEMASVRS
jgi:excinuclease UvrABC ATPase subunit